MSKDSQKYTLIMGCHALEGVLKHSPERMVTVYHLPLSNKSHDRKQKLVHELHQREIPLKISSKKELDQLCGSESHQGIIAFLKKRDLVDVSDFIQTNQSQLVVAIDSIVDPHNLGAILRACECFGVGLVLWSKNRGAPLSATVTKTSSSATEFVPISIVSNLSTTLDKFQNAGYELIGAQVGHRSVNLYDYTFPKLSVLVLGSEGEGIRPLLQSKLDQSIYIPMHGKIDSLNVSQAAAVCIGQWSAQHYSL